MCVKTMDHNEFGKYYNSFLDEVVLIDGGKIVSVCDSDWES